MTYKDLSKMIKGNGNMFLFNNIAFTIKEDNNYLHFIVKSKEWIELNPKNILINPESTIYKININEKGTYSIKKNNYKEQTIIPYGRNDLISLFSGDNINDITIKLITLTELNETKLNQILNQIQYS